MILRKMLNLGLSLPGKCVLTTQFGVLPLVLYTESSSADIPISCLVVYLVLYSSTDMLLIVFYIYALIASICTLLCQVRESSMLYYKAYINARKGKNPEFRCFLYSPRGKPYLQ